MQYRTYLLLCLCWLPLSASVMAQMDRVLSLDGDGDYVELSKSLPDMTELTIEAWVLYEGGQTIFMDATSAGGNDFVFGMSAFGVGIRADKSGATLNFEGPPAITGLNLANSWHHIAWTMTSSESKVYVDGVLKAVENNSGSNVGFHAANPSIGRWWDEAGTSDYFKGLIDELRIWNTVRKSSEILKATNRPLTTEEIDSGSLVGYWNFDNGTANDLSLSGNHGTLVNGANITETELPIPVSAIFVSPTGSDVTGDGSESKPYQTIQIAINESRRNDIISVAAGTYNENVTLVNDLQLQGDGAQVTTITAGSGNVVTAHNVFNTTISGFTIDGGNTAERGVSISGLASNLSVTSNTISGSKRGILCTDNSAATLRNNTVDQNLEYGIHCIGQTRAVIEKNHISNNGLEGILCHEASEPTIHQNTVTANTGVGIMISGNSKAIVTGNHLSENSVGFWFRDTSSASIRSNTIEFNRSEGIHCSSNQGTQIIGNMIAHNRSGGFYCNNESNPLIMENFIHSNDGTALTLTHSSQPILIRNSLRDNKAGISIGLEANPTIGGDILDANVIVDNGGAVDNQTDNVIDATYNNWGTTDETEIANMMRNGGNGDIIFKPFIGDPEAVGDTSGDGTVSAYDAALILQYVVGIITEFPANKLSTQSPSTPHHYTLALPEITARTGERIQVPISINDTTGLIAGGMTLRYPSKLLQPIRVFPTPLLSGYHWKSSLSPEVLAQGVHSNNEIRIAFAGLPIHTNSGELIYVEFEILPNSGQWEGTLVLESAEILDSLGVTVQHGLVTILPSEFRLLQNYPNPFNPETWIPYQLAEDAQVSLRIYDLHGKLVRELNLGHKPAGVYLERDTAAYWDGRSDTGERVSSGVYIYQLRAGADSAVKRMVILK